jgi:DNA-directed RNA polymerase subunit F
MMNMGSMMIYNSKEACILYIKKRNYVYLAVEGFINSEKIKEFYESLVKVCREKNIKRILFDTSKLGAIKENDLQWIFQSTADTVNPLNIYKIAFLSPKNVFGSRTVSKIFSELHDLKAEVFDNMEDAENWLFEDNRIN